MAVDERVRPGNAILLAMLLVAVGAAVLAAHWPALSAQALSFDDTQYLTENPLVRNPGWHSAKRFLTEILEPSTVRGYYQPLAMISLMLDHALGGRADDLRPFHRTSLGLHILNTGLVIVLLYLLFGEPWSAAMVGLLFGLHPLTVEPIPWVGERKTLLAAFFALLSLIVYVRYTRRPNWRLYAGVLVLFVLALMSKPTVTPLPVLLLLLDYWPLGRLNKRAVLEKLPLLVMAGLFAVVTIISQARTCAIYLPTEQTSGRIPLILCHNIIFYLYKMAWPVNLSSHYAFPQPLSLSHPMMLAGVLGTALLIPLLLLSWNKTRAFLVGWLFFFVAVFPTMGVIGFTHVIASDKFVYFPSLGLLLVATWLLTRYHLASPVPRHRGRRMVAALVLVVFLAGCECVATRRYLTHWRNSESLYEHMASLAPRAPSVRWGLGYYLQSQGKLDAAVASFRKALELDPGCLSAHNNLAVTLKRQGHIGQAIHHYLEALKINPADAETHCNLGVALKERGDLDAAVEHYCEALRLKPKLAGAHTNLGTALYLKGRLDEAIQSFQQAIRLYPQNAMSHNNLAAALIEQGQYEPAVQHAREAVRLRPDLAMAHLNLGKALTAQGYLDQGIQEYRKVLRIDPHHGEARQRLDQALAERGEPGGP